MTTPTRPTCGTCPHRIGRSEKLVSSYDGCAYDSAVVHRCSAVPYTSDFARPEVEENDDGCIHHPDMPAYVEAWRLAREVKP